MPEEQKKKVIDIRRADATDAVKIYRIIKEAFDETALLFPKPEPNASIEWIINIIKNNGTVYVAECSGRIVGSVGLQPMEFPWVSGSERWYLSNVWFYVHPKYRGYGTAEKLVDKAIEFAKAAKVLVAFGVTMEKNVELKERFLRMQRMQYVGANFLYQEHLVNNDGQP